MTILFLSDNQMWDPSYPWASPFTTFFLLPLARHMNFQRPENPASELPGKKVVIHNTKETCDKAEWLIPAVERDV